MEDTRNRPSCVSRRQFITASATGLAASVGTSGLVSAAALPRQWSRTVDVVVVGSGAAGMSAAIAATLAGSSVVILEKAASAGGTTVKSDGAYWVPNNHLMRAKGIVDARHDAINYMARASYPVQYREDQPRFGLDEHDHALLAAFFDHGAAVIEAFEEAGALASLISEAPDYVEAPQDKAIGRMLMPKTPGGPGPGLGRVLVKQMRDWLTEKKIPILTRHAVTGLERNAAREVVGVTVDTANGPLAIQARKGVVFASGGFTHNYEMMRNTQPGPTWGGCAVPTNTGDFVNIGIDNGTKLGNMVNAWRAQVVLERVLESPSVSRDVFELPGDSSLLVNRTGRRVVNEKHNYNDRTRAHFVWDANTADYPNKFLFMIFDQRVLDLYAGHYPIPEQGTDDTYVIKASTVAELGAAIQKRLDSLGARIGANPLSADFSAKLSAQIARFNADAESGVDQDFDRGRMQYDLPWQMAWGMPRADTRWPANTGANRTMYPLDKGGPLFAIILAAGTLDTKGGPVIDAQARVLNTRNEVIPGLYGAGNCIASPSAESYWGAGCTIGLALTFGAIAGKGAAQSAVRSA